MSESDNFFWARKHGVEFNAAMKLLTQEQYDIILKVRYPSRGIKAQQDWIKANVKEDV